MTKTLKILIKNAKVGEKFEEIKWEKVREKESVLAFSNV